jgi:probable O-glycosylation ligase (exosortase A-associated)
MKQLILMMALTLLGTVGPFLLTPFVGVAVYYLFAVLRPQALWNWVLPQFAWSFYVAVGTIIATTLAMMMRSHAAAVRQTADRSVRRVTLTHLAMLAFGTWLVISFLMAQFPDASEPMMIEYAKIWVMFAIASIVVRTRTQAFTLVTVAAASLAYIAYEVNYKYLFQGGYLGIYHNGYGGLDNNGAGLMLAMGVPLCVAVWDGGTKWWRWIFAALVPVIVHAVLMTYSRGAMVALLLASPLILLRSRRRMWMATAATVMMLIVPLLAGQEIRRRFFSIEQYQEDGSAQSRITSWRVALAIANDYPVFGVGPRNANFYTYYYGADMWGRTIHSQSLQLMADTGYVGFAGYASVIACTALTLRRSRNRWKRDRSEQGHQLYAMAYGIEASLATFFLGTFFLSLELFELPYLLVLLAAQLPTLVREPAKLPAATPLPVPSTPPHMLPRPAYQIKRPAYQIKVR